jgi:hypothetical protein
MKVVHSVASSTAKSVEEIPSSPSQLDPPLPFDIDSTPPPPISETNSEDSQVLRFQNTTNVENNCEETNVDLIVRDSLGSDEWENDDDLGYVIIQLTEQEFFELEQVQNKK